MRLNFRAAFRALIDTTESAPAAKVFRVGAVVAVDSAFYRASSWPRFGNGMGTVLQVISGSDHPYLVQLIGEARPTRYSAAEVFTVDDPRVASTPIGSTPSAGPWARWQRDAVAASRLRR